MHQNDIFTLVGGRPLEIQGGGARKIRRREIIYFMSKRRENIFFTFKRRQNICLTFSVTADIHGAWVQIFISPLLRRNLFISPFLRRNLFISKFFLAPPLGYLMVAPIGIPTIPYDPGNMEQYGRELSYKQIRRAAAHHEEAICPVMNQIWNSRD